MEYEVRPCLHTTSMSPVLYRSKMGSMVMFMHNIKNIQDAANKIGDIDGKCKQGLRLNVIIHNLYGMHGFSLHYSGAATIKEHFQSCSV